MKKHHSFGRKRRKQMKPVKSYGIARGGVRM